MEIGRELSVRCNADGKDMKNQYKLKLIAFGLIHCLVGCDFTSIRQRPWTKEEVEQRAMERREYARRQRELPASERSKQEISIENLDLYFEISNDVGRE